jgi:hypothetical protein
MPKKSNFFGTELLILLFEKDYFGFPDRAKNYVDRLFDYVERNISIIPGQIRGVTKIEVAESSADTEKKE